MEFVTPELLTQVGVLGTITIAGAWLFQMLMSAYIRTVDQLTRRVDDQSDEIRRLRDSVDKEREENRRLMSKLSSFETRINRIVAAYQTKSQNLRQEQLRSEHYRKQRDVWARAAIRYAETQAKPMLIAQAKKSNIIQG